MSETKVAYTVTAQPATKHARVPARWLSFLYRMATLKGGRVYNMILEIPERQDDAITWTFLGDGKRENEG